MHYSLITKDYGKRALMHSVQWGIRGVSLQE